MPLQVEGQLAQLRSQLEQSERGAAAAEKLRLQLSLTVESIYIYMFIYRRRSKFGLSSQRRSGAENKILAM